MKFKGMKKRKDTYTEFKAKNQIKEDRSKSNISMLTTDNPVQTSDAFDRSLYICST